MTIWGFKQSCVLGYSLEWKLERCAIPILDLTFVALVKASISLIVSLLFSITRGWSKVYQRESRLLVRNVLLTLILIVVNLIRLTWTCILALLIESRKEIFKDRPRRRLDHQERLTMFDRVIHVIVDIICLVDHDWVFLEVLNALIATKIYALISILDFFRSMRTFVTLV